MKKLLIILPDGRIHKIDLGWFKKSFREAPLTATVLASLVPEELKYDITIADESVQEIPFKQHFDVVAISVLTGNSKRAYELARFFRNRGSIVVLGGVHVTILPEEAAIHADSIVIGFAEKTWPQLLYDLENGDLRPVYREMKNHFGDLPVPRRDLQASSRYMIPYVVNATRGCKSFCDFCAVPAAKFGWQTRPLGSVIDEIKSIPVKKFVFNDVSLGEDPDYFKSLLKALIPLKKKWGGLVSIKVFRDEEILRLLEQSGCAYLLIGFESLNDLSLKYIHKGFNRFEEYKEVIRKLRSINVILMACFIFGFEEDDVHVFDNTVDFVNTYQVNIPRYAIYTPYPGTVSFDRLMAEERILHTQWDHYDTQHVVFKPKQMTPEELDRGFKKAYMDTFGLKSSLQRTISSGKNFLLTFGGNMAYNLYLKRLFLEKDRIRNYHEKEVNMI